MTLIDMRISPYPALIALALVSCESVMEPLTGVGGRIERSGEIVIDVRMSKREYVPGDALEFAVRPSEDCTLEIGVIGVDGSRTILHPLPGTDDRVYRAGVAAPFPARGERRVLRVRPPAGEETLVVNALGVRAARNEFGDPAPASSGARPYRSGHARLTYRILDAAPE